MLYPYSMPKDIGDAGASWDLFTQVLTNEKPNILQFKSMKALAVLNDSYDLRLQMRSYELNNFLISWEGYYDTSQNALFWEVYFQIALGDL